MIFIKIQIIARFTDPRFFRDPCLLCRRDVHDDAALGHLRETGLHLERARLSARAPATWLHEVRDVNACMSYRPDG